MPARVRLKIKPEPEPVKPIVKAPVVKTSGRVRLKEMHARDEPSVNMEPPPVNPKTPIKYKTLTLLPKLTGLESMRQWQLDLGEGIKLVLTCRHPSYGWWLWSAGFDGAPIGRHETGPFGTYTLALQHVLINGKKLRKALVTLKSKLGG